MKLQDLLEGMSPYTNVKIRDFDGENILFAGYAKEALETAFKYVEVRTYYFAFKTLHINIL